MASAGVAVTRVLVCGGRDYADRARVFHVLDHYHGVRPFSVLIHGAATGADSLADEWAAFRGVPVERYTANWNDLETAPVVIRHRSNGTAYNAAAGGIRNAVMIRHGRPDVGIVFPGGKGTRDMRSRLLLALGDNYVLDIAP